MEPRETWEPKETRYHVPWLAGRFTELLPLLLFKCAIFQLVDGWCGCPGTQEHLLSGTVTAGQLGLCLIPPCCQP